MADKYIDSAATGSNNGTSWANAYTTFATAAGADSAGDVFYVKSTYSESTAAAVTYDWAGTAASPTRIICVSDNNEPPTTIATGAVVATTGNNNHLTIASSFDFVYFYGIRFKAGDSTNSADVGFAPALAFSVCENCAFELAGNNTGSDFVNGGGGAVLTGCTFKSANASSQIELSGLTSFNMCSIESGGTPGAPFFILQSGHDVVISGFDFTNLSASASLIASNMATARLLFRNCKMPSSWSVSVNSSTPGAGSVFELNNCDSTDTNYRLQRKTQFGEITHETTLKRTGGASDGTTGISWKMVSNADAEWNHQTLDTPEIVRWNETTGSSITVTVEILHDSATNVTDKELWLEVQYLGTSGYPLASLVTDAASNYLSSAADQTDSSETWTTTGMSNPNTQKLNVSFTPQEKGFIHAVARLAKASKTVYVDPLLTVS